MSGVELGVIVVSTIVALAFLRFAVAVIVGITWYAVRPFVFVLWVVARIIWWIAGTSFGAVTGAKRAFCRHRKSARSAAHATLRDAPKASSRSARPMPHDSMA